MESRRNSQTTARPKKKDDRRAEIGWLGYKAQENRATEVLSHAKLRPDASSSLELEAIN